MKKLFLLLAITFPVHAAQVISTACIQEVTTKLEYRFTIHPNGTIHVWERHDTPILWTVWHNCFLYPITPSTQTTNGFTISSVMAGGIRSVTNPANGKWFQTNAVGIEQDQAGLDWCTQ